MVYCGFLIRLELIGTGLVLDFLTFFGVPLFNKKVYSFKSSQVVSLSFLYFIGMIALPKQKKIKSFSFLFT